MKASSCCFILHLLSILVIVGQDTIVSDSFFGENPLIYYIFYSLVFLSLVCYSSTLADPGFLRPNEEVESDFYCNSCQRRVPVRYFHCDKCHQCTRRQLFHSKLTDTCIGFNNYMYYFLFLVSASLYILFMIFVSVYSIIQKIDSFRENKASWLLHHGLLIISTPCLVFALIQFLILLIQNFFVILTNGNVLEVKKFLLFYYLSIQPASHNPYFSSDIQNNLSYVFFPMPGFDDPINKSAKFNLYIEDIQKYKNIDYIKNDH